MTMSVTLTVVCLILISFPTNLDAEEQVIRLYLIKFHGYQSYSILHVSFYENAKTLLFVIQIKDSKLNLI